MLNNFFYIFGPDFKKHLAFIFTRWDTSKKAIKTRKLMEDQTERSKTKEINDELIRLKILQESDL